MMIKVWHKYLWYLIILTSYLFILVTHCENTVEIYNELESEQQVLQGIYDGMKLKYVWGDAISNPEAIGPDGTPYPWDIASQIVGKQRRPRSVEPLLTPEETRNILLSTYEDGIGTPNRYRREIRTSNFKHGSGSGERVQSPPAVEVDEGCVPPRLCPTTYNTTAPLYGVSLTSGRPVTIVQKFPDLLQQVVFQVCKRSTCEVLQGDCVQTYLPYLFLVIPLGPVTLTGQDYVLVESGCTCRPKYAKKFDEPPPLPFIQPFNTSTTTRSPTKFINNKHHYDR